jgi:hypothetical protein
VLPQCNFYVGSDLKADQNDNLYFSNTASDAAGRTFYYFSSIRRLRNKNTLEMLAGCGFAGEPFNQLQGTKLLNGKPVLADLNRKPAKTLSTTMIM